jgi:glycosyltransferase involved in cell wall biosynthesis
VTGRGQPGGDLTLSVVIPAYEEPDRLLASVEAVLKFLGTRPYRSELLVVVDGGKAGALQAMQIAADSRPNVTLLDNGVNRGKGFSVRRGVLAAAGRFVLFADADLSLPIEDADRFVEALEGGYDVAIGSRAVPGARETGDRPAFRRWMGQGFNRLVQWVLLPGFSDTQCGFKAFRRDAAQAVFRRQRLERFGFDVEILWIATSLGYRIVELPVTCRYHSTSSVRRLRDALSMIRDLLRVRVNARRGLYR